MISNRTIGELRPVLLMISQLTLDLRSSLLFFHVFPLSISIIPLTALLFVPKSETFQPLLTSPVQYFPSPTNINSRKAICVVLAFLFQLNGL